METLNRNETIWTIDPEPAGAFDSSLVIPDTGYWWINDPTRRPF